MNSKIDKVAIIILNYNGYKDTIECLESLKKANYGGIKISILVIDNGSSNDSVSRISEWLKANASCYSIIENESDPISALTLYKGKENLGFSGGNNIGIQLALKASVDYIVLLNNDTVVDVNFLQPLLTIARDDPKIGLIGSKIIDYYHRSHFILGGYIDVRKCSGYHFYDTEKADLEDISFTSGCIWLIPAKAFKSCGLMDPNYFLYVEDVDFCYRVKKSGYKITCTKDSIVYHKEGRSTVIKPTVTYYNTRNRLYFAHKLNESFGNKLAFYIYFGVTRLLKMITKPQLAPYIWKGVMDFRRHFYGKYE